LVAGGVGIVDDGAIGVGEAAAQPPSKPRQVNTNILGLTRMALT
jgi:hypothetical protein